MERSIQDYCSEKNPGVYKLKDLATGKITEQHIENIKEKIIMAREAEVPISECPNARLPFPQTEENIPARQQKRIPEGHAADDWIDDSFWLTPAPYLGGQRDQSTEVDERITEEQPETIINQSNPRRSRRLANQERTG